MNFVSRLCAACAILIGSSILLCNFFKIDLNGFTDPQNMPKGYNAGLCILMSGMILLIAGKKSEKRDRILYLCGSGIIFFLSLYALTRYFLSADAKLMDVPPCPGGIPLYTSICFLLISCCLLFYYKPGKRSPVPNLIAQVVFFFAIFIVLTRLFKAVSFAGWFTYCGMSLYTAIALVFISIGFISTHPEYKIVKAFESKGSAGVILRSILLPVFILLPLLSYLRVLGENLFYFNAGYGTAVMTALMLAFFTVIVSNVCYQLDSKERRLLESENLFSSLVKSVKEYAIFMLDPNGNIISWNEGAKRLKGYEEEEIIGKHFSIFYTKEEIVAKAPETNLKKAREQGHFETEGFRLRKNGTRFLADVVITPLYDSESRLIGFIKITRDITERKKMAETKNEMLLLEQKHKELENFTYILSHDVLAPLRNISMLSEWIAKDYSDKLDEKGKEYLQLMNEKIKLLATMIDEALVYIRAGKTASDREEVDTEEMIQDVIKMQTVPSRSSIVADNKFPKVLVSKTALKQVFTNLVDNAIKHNDKKEAVIHIGLYDEGEQWKFYIRDNGPGIPMENREKVFRIFKNHEKDSGEKGYGIGLATVKRIVENEGGKIWIESAEGGGSIFFFTIKKVKK